MYFSGHLLDGYSMDIQSIEHTELSQLASEEETVRDGDKVNVVGIVSKITRKNTKNGEVMAFVTVEDRYSEIEILVFPKVYNKYAEIIVPDAALTVSGTLSRRDDEAPKLLANDIRELKRNQDIQQRQVNRRIASQMGGAFGAGALLGAMRMANAVKQTSAPAEKTPAPAKSPDTNQRSIDKLCLKVPSMSSEKAKKAENLIAIFCGNTRVLFYDASEKKYVALSNYGADSSARLIAELEALLGKENVAVVYQPE